MCLNVVCHELKRCTLYVLLDSPCIILCTFFIKNKSLYSLGELSIVCWQKLMIHEHIAVSTLSECVPTRARREMWDSKLGKFL